MSSSVSCCAVAGRTYLLLLIVRDVSPAWSGLLVLPRDFIRSLRLFLFGLLIPALVAGAGVLATRGSRTLNDGENLWKGSPCKLNTDE